MQIHLSPRHLVLTAAIHSHVAEKVSHLESLTDEIIAAHVVLLHDEKKNPKKAYHVKVHLAVPGPDIHAEDGESDLYVAIDKVVAKIAQQLRKRKTKLKDKVKHDLQRAAEKKKLRG
jgi:putative sigma-54 modulation protein